MRKKAIPAGFDGLKCSSCTHMATKTTEGKGHFLLYGCKKVKPEITFGNATDWKAKKGWPKNCREFGVRVYGGV